MHREGAILLALVILASAGLPTRARASTEVPPTTGELDPSTEGTLHLSVRMPIDPTDRGWEHPETQYDLSGRICEDCHVHFNVSNEARVTVRVNLSQARVDAGLDAPWKEDYPGDWTVYVECRVDGLPCPL